MWSLLLTTASSMVASFFTEYSLDALGILLKIFTDGLGGRDVEGGKGEGTA